MGKVVTGVRYVDPDQRDLHDLIRAPQAPLNSYSDPDLCPGQAALDRINASMR